jgi:hypothetical protein
MLSSILNKLINQRKREWIEDYCLQLAGYAMAHNFIYKTSITKGVVMMCSKDNILSGICNRRIRVTKIST